MILTTGSKPRQLERLSPFPERKKKNKLKKQFKTTFCSQVEEKHLLFTALKAVKDMEEQTPEVNTLSLEIMNKGLCFCLRARIG